MSAEDDARAELVEKVRDLAHERGYTTSGELFRAFDGDGDGALVPHELKALLAAADVGNGFTRGTWVSRIFERLDLDESEGLTLQELNGVMKQLDFAPPRTVPFESKPAEQDDTRDTRDTSNTSDEDEGGLGALLLVFALLFAIAD